MEKIKSFTLRVPKSLWEHTKTAALQEEKSINSFVMELIKKNKKNYSKSVDESK